MIMTNTDWKATHKYVGRGRYIKVSKPVDSASKKIFQVFNRGEVTFIAFPNNFGMFDILDEQGNYYGGWSTIEVFLSERLVTPQIVGKRRLVPHEVK